MSDLSAFTNELVITFDREGSLWERPFAEACPKDPEESLEENFAGHLRFSDSPIWKTNGNFYNSKAQPRHSIGQFYLKGVTLCLDSVQFDAF